jgi:ATP-dependent RNA helicase A
VDFVEGMVRLDNWINLEMNAKDAAAICALRKVLEDILLISVQQPEEVLNLDERYQKAIGVIRALSEMTAGDFEITRDTGISTDRESSFGGRGPGGPSGFGGGKFPRNDGGNFRGGYQGQSGGYQGQSGGYQRGGFNNSNRGFNNRRGFGYGR